ncbi:MAG TPA: leucyl aminopeptidase [Planctomycetota bacterium]|nr:leucyl aminopeptidase [Planctomycetota bacterium]
MRLLARPRSEVQRPTPLLVLLVDDGPLRELPGGELGRRAVALRGRKVFEGGRGKSLLLHADGAGGARALLLVGLGTLKSVAADDWRRAGAIAVNQAAELKAGRLVIGWAGKLDPDAAALQALAEGAVMAGYRYSGKQAESTPPAQVAVATSARGAAAALRTGQVLGESANLVRELGDGPGNTVTPRHLANTARRLARAGGLRCRVHGKAALRRLKMTAILAVNQGSAQEPFLIEMEYRAPRARRTLCIVGKGLTFDSGGISIKPADKMEEMKYDMCGAGAVLGLMRALSILKPKGLRVIGIVGTTENMPGPAAYKPGDVVRAANGKTIEVINTDAEGRVVLADAIHHATRFQPEAIVDLATLTGAIVVSLGSEAAGLFCKDDRLAGRLLAASARTDERLWRMPTYDEYGDKIKSKVADIKNSSGREAGSCTAAQFLFHFSGDIPHAHLDIAGTAWNQRRREWCAEGGTGFGVRLLYDALTHWEG